MELSSVSAPLIAATLTFSSVILIVIVEVIREINRRSDIGETTKNYERLAWILTIAALLSVTSSIVLSLILIFESGIYPTIDFAIVPTLYFAGYVLFLISTVIVSIGIIYLIIRTVGIQPLSDLRSWLF
jgi:ABC-type multidrug transport system permease subunit